VSYAAPTLERPRPAPAPHRDPSAALSGPHGPRSGAIGVVVRAVVLTLARFAGRVAGAWPRWRTTVMTVAGFGCMVAAAWSVALWAGLAAAGLSLLALEALGGPET
jgi:hypothetical protein